MMELSVRVRGLFKGHVILHLLILLSIYIHISTFRISIFTFDLSLSSCLLCAIYIDIEWKSMVSV